ncbi:MAG: ydcM [Acidimicrobiaceae bacterium]|nr:ydcM [Acidimicrobiaceae bacterium]
MRIRLEPNRAQESYLLGCAGASRKAYNFAVEQFAANHKVWSAERDAGVPAEKCTRPLSDRRLQDAWHAQKDDIAPWHGEYPSKIYLYALRRARAAHAEWMAGRAGFPRFKSKHRQLPAFTVCETISLEAGALRLPRMERLGLGLVKISAPDTHQATLRRSVRRSRARIVSVTVRRDSCGTWWASLSIERTVTSTPQLLAPNGVVGIDVGVKTLVVAAGSDAVPILEASGAKALREAEHRLRVAQRRVSRKDRSYAKAIGAPHPRRSPSAKREQARRRVARLHRQVRDQRHTVLHQTTRQLADLGAVLVIEDLNVRGMKARGGARKSGLNRHLHDASFGELRRQLTYKLPADRLIVADRFFPSSKRCRLCGVDNQRLTLTDRTWTCTCCGTSHDRDANAAANLATWGEAAVTADVLLCIAGHVPDADADAQAGDRHEGGPTAGRTLHSQPTRHARGGDKQTRRVTRRGPASADLAATGTR